MADQLIVKLKAIDWFCFLFVHAMYVLLFNVVLMGHGLEKSFFAMMAALIITPFMLYLVSLIFRRDEKRFFLSLIIYLGLIGFFQMVILIGKTKDAPSTQAVFPVIFAALEIASIMGLRKALTSILSKP